MGIVLIYGLITLLIFQSVAIYVFIRSYRKKSKIGITIAVIMTFISLRLLLINHIDELTIEKSDVKSDLANINISISNNFEILSNKVSGMPERYQTTSLKISKQDANSIIEKIKSDSNFRRFETTENIICNRSDGESFERNLILNFKYPEIYARETYKNIENIPTRIQLRIKENNDTLEYIKIED